MMRFFIAFLILGFLNSACAKAEKRSCKICGQMDSISSVMKKNPERALKEDFSEKATRALESLSQKKLLNEKEIASAVELLYQALAVDETNYPAEVIFPSYKKQKKAFDKMIKKLSKKEADRVSEGLKIYQRVLIEGNGG